MQPAHIMCLVLSLLAAFVALLAFLAQRQTKRLTEGEESTLGGFGKHLRQGQYMAAVLWLAGCVLVRIVLNRGWILVALLSMATAASVCTNFDFLALVQWLFKKTCQLDLWPAAACKDPTAPIGP